MKKSFLFLLLFSLIAIIPMGSSVCAKGEPTIENANINVQNAASGNSWGFDRSWYGYGYKPWYGYNYNYPYYNNYYYPYYSTPSSNNFYRYPYYRYRWY